jgi:hypothetical protein
MSSESSISLTLRLVPLLAKAPLPGWERLHFLMLYKLLAHKEVRRVVR